MVTIYSDSKNPDNDSRIEYAKAFLEEKNIEYTIEDIKVIYYLSDMDTPIIKVNDKYYNYNDAISIIENK